MGRKQIWFDGEYKSYKVKLEKETSRRYDMYLMAKGKTSQQFLEESIIRELS